MKGIIRVGDKTSHDGIVKTGGGGLKFMGKEVACKGDKVSCPRHGSTEISEGDESSKFNGKAIALHGHKCGCECTLMTSLPNAGKG